MKKIVYSAVFSLVLLMGFSCTDYDNYDKPQETLKGSVVDKNTKRTLQTETNDAGIRIKLLEYSWSDDPTPYYFYSMQDGTFNNTKIFKGNYNVSVEGAFVPIIQRDNNGNVIKDDSKTVDIKGTVDLTFEVEPFLNVEWVGEPVLNADKTVTVNVKITRGTSDANYQKNITDLYLFVNTNPYTGNNNYDNNYSTQIRYDGSDANSLLGTTISLTTKAALPASRTFYLRVGARIDYETAGRKRYNYNEVKSVQIP